VLSQTSKTVLLAEDDDGIRRLLTALLTSMDVHLIVAANGAEALQKARQQDGRIDCLISDIRMPEMSGVELAQRLCSERPDMKVLLMSGSAGQTLALTNGWLFMEKPFRAANFTARVNRILQTPTESSDRLSEDRMGK
jgi:DNA-binding NtrC family response regulator